MNRQNIILLIIQNISDDDNIVVEIVENYLEDLDLEDELLEAHRTLHVHNENYYEITIPQYSLDDFHAYFRMKRTTMERLINVIEQHMDQREFYIVPLEKQVALTVWILAKAESFLAVGDRFGMSASTAHYCFQNIIRTLASLLGTYIKWPNTVNMENSVKDFENRSRGIPGVIGAIDGCHIPIMQPHNNATDYYNRKSFHSVILQAVCDSRKRFIDVHIGMPGRMHDARVFRNSPLYQNIMYHNLIPNTNHLIGDTAYPLSNFLITPYKDNGHLTRGQIIYNNRLSSIRSTIERAFALLKGKFRKLKYLEMYNMDLINYAIASACILHNFLLIEEGDCDEYDEVENEENDLNIEVENEENDVLNIEVENVEIRNIMDKGQEKRNAIVEILS